MSAQSHRSQPGLLGRRTPERDHRSPQVVGLAGRVVGLDKIDAELFRFDK